MRKKTPAVFLDRDGTILNERGYLSDPAKMVFYPSAFKALKRLQNHGFKLVVVSNQSGVGRGYFSLATLSVINRIFKRRLAARGVRIAGIYFCPHHPDAQCACRKPGTLMIRRAVRDLNIDLKKSFVVGDQDRDIGLARAAGVPGVLVLTGAGKLYRQTLLKKARKIVQNLEAASRWITSTK